MSNRQYLWIKIFYAASSVAVVSWGRSTWLAFPGITCRRRRVLASVLWGAMAPTTLDPWEFRSQPGTQTSVHRCRRLCCTPSSTAPIPSLLSLLARVKSLAAQH